MHCLGQLFPCRWSAIETGQGERWARGASHGAADATGDCLRSLLPPTLTPSQLPDAPRADCTEIVEKVGEEIKLTHEERCGPPHVPSLL